MSALAELMDIRSNIEELWAKLADIAPEETELLRSLLSSVESAVTATKSELREAGPGAYEADGLRFSVRPGPSKVVFNTEDVIMEAEEEGHLEQLLEAGFLCYSVNPTQLDRLDPELRAVYSKFSSTKEGTPRVYLPKDLWK